MSAGEAKPLISVIVPVYNASSFLHRSLASVLRQTLSDFELIVIDDCSTDESATIVQRYQTLDDRVRLLSTETNGGPGIARNVGLRNARGRYIAFLDADDFWMRGKLERQIRTFDDDEVILSYTSSLLLTRKGGIRGIVNARPTVSLRDMKFCNWITLSSAMFRKELIGAEKMPGMRSRQDYAYWISLLEKNPGHGAGVQEALVGYVRMPGSISSNTFRNLVNSFRMYVSEVGMSPISATVAVAMLSACKIKKELMARLCWMRLPEHQRQSLQREVERSWNCGGDLGRSCPTN